MFEMTALPVSIVWQPKYSFRRLFENVWVSGEDRLVVEEDFLACVTLDGPLEPEHGRRYVIGLDSG